MSSSTAMSDFDAALEAAVVAAETQWQQNKKLRAAPTPAPAPAPAAATQQANGVAGAAARDVLRENTAAAAATELPHKKSSRLATTVVSPSPAVSTAMSDFDAALEAATVAAETQWQQNKKLRAAPAPAPAPASAPAPTPAPAPAAAPASVLDMTSVEQVTRWFQRHQSMLESGGGGGNVNGGAAKEGSAGGGGASNSPADDAGGMATDDDANELYADDDPRDANGRRLGAAARRIWCTLPMDCMVDAPDTRITARCRTQRDTDGDGPSGGAPGGAPAPIECPLSLTGMPASLRRTLTPLFETAVVTYSIMTDLRRAATSHNGLAVTTLSDRVPRRPSVDVVAHLLVRCELNRLYVMRRVSAAQSASGRPDDKIVDAIARINRQQLPIALYREAARRVMIDAGLDPALGGDTPLTVAVGERLFEAMLRHWAGGGGGGNNVQRAWSLRRDTEVVRYLGWPTLQRLRLYYTPRALEQQLRWRTPYTLRLWLQRVLVTPIDACFMRAGVCTQLERVAECFDAVDDVPVPPELSLRAAVRVLIDTQAVVDTADLASVAVYHALRRVSAQTGAVCVSARDLCSNTRYAQRFLAKVEPRTGVLTLTDARFRDALALLRGRGVVHFMYQTSTARRPAAAGGDAADDDTGPRSVAELCDGNHWVLLDYHHRSLSLLYDALCNVRTAARAHAAETEAAAPPSGASSSGASEGAERFEIPAKACDEQRAALESYRDPRNFLLLIDGPGGAGKSELLHMIVTLCPQTVRIGAAVPNQVVDMLRKRLSVTNVWTLHALIYGHLKCHTHPDWRSPKFASLHYERCLFENVEELIVDECSVADLPLLGVLLWLMTRCSNGRLRRVILCGDHKQLSSIQPGNLWSEMLAVGRRSFLTRRPSLDGVATHRFVHNHRIGSDTAPELRRLLDFNRHVRDGAAAEAAALVVPWPLDQPVPAPAGAPSVTLVPYEMRGGDDTGSIRSMVRSGIRALDRMRRVGETADEFVCRHAVITYRNDAVREYNRQLGDYLCRLRHGVLGAPGDAQNLDGLGDYRQDVYDPRVLYAGQKVQSKRTIDDYGLNNNGVFFLRHITVVDRTGTGATQYVPHTGAATGRDGDCFLHLYPFIAGVVQPARELRVPYDHETRECIVSANCTTNHAFQGGQQQLVVYSMLMPRDGSDVVGEFHHETQESLYTGCSRAQQQLVLVAPSVGYVGSIVARPAKERPTGILQYVQMREAAAG